MDTSKEYKLQCEKAFDDIGFVGETIYCIFQNKIYRVMEEYVLEEKDTGHKQGQFLLKFLKIDKFGDEYEENNWIIDEDTMPLYTQDQLQGMVKPERDCAFNYIGNIVRWIDKNVMYACKFDTMEQLRLVFVMQEKYHKIWNGKDFIGESI